MRREGNSTVIPKSHAVVAVAAKGLCIAGKPAQG
jgi:hypothetical protein